MNFVSVLSTWQKRALILAGASLLLLVPDRLVRADPSEAMAVALSAAQDWIGQIDAGQYDESYMAGCDEFRQKVTEQKWVLVLKAFRPAFGEVVSRKEVSHVYKANGVNGLDGECLVINYDTSFKHLQNGYETVVIKWENGKWRGAAYVAGPKTSDQSGGEDAPPDIDTQVDTTHTTHPQQ